MEYPQRKKPIFKRPRKLPISQRYPRTFYGSLVTVSMLIFFSRPIYDILFRPAFIDPYSLSKYIYFSLI